MHPDMNNIFNINRFGRLFVKHTVEHYKGYLMSLSVLLGVMLLGGSFIVYMIEVPMESNLQLAIFGIVLLLAGTMFTSTIFADFGDKNKAMTALTLPASHFEKFLVAWLYSFGLFVVIYTGCFYLVMLFLVSVKHFPGQHEGILNIFHRDWFPLYLLFAFMHSIAFCGAIFFKKLHFIKTAFIFFIGLAILIVVNKGFQQILLGKDVMMNIPFGGVRFTDNNKVDINLTAAQETNIYLLLGGLALIFWTAAYFRLKEKQV
jgi:hypothetical protein